LVGGEVMKNYFKYFLSICFIIGLCLHSEFVFAESLKGNALKQGDCIGIVAPASGIEDMNIADAINKLQNWGYKVKLSSNLYQQSGYLAGSDQMRAEDLNNFFADDEVDAILCLRGG
jgi:muramoyltetrapeptide carboxypeptidase